MKDEGVINLLMVINSESCFVFCGFIFVIVDNIYWVIVSVKYNKVYVF